MVPALTIEVLHAPYASAFDVGAWLLFPWVALCSVAPFAVCPQFVCFRVCVLPLASALTHGLLTAPQTHACLPTSTGMHGISSMTLLAEF